MGTRIWPGRYGAARLGLTWGVGLLAEPGAVAAAAAAGRCPPPAEGRRCRAALGGLMVETLGDKTMKDGGRGGRISAGA